MKKVQIKILDSRLHPPAYVTLGSAGMDVRAMFNAQAIHNTEDGKSNCGFKYINNEPDKKWEINPDILTLKAGGVILIPTGFAMHIADKLLAAVLLPRSGIGHKNGIILANGSGLLDSDYQKQVYVSLWNRSDKDFIINVGDRIAQMVFVPVVQVEFESVTEFEDNQSSRVDGFGHTGNN